MIIWNYKANVVVDASAEKVGLVDCITRVANADLH